MPLSAGNLSRRLPDENPVHRVFVTKKPSLRRDSIPEMKSFSNQRNPTAGFSSDSDLGSPVNRRYGSYSSPSLPAPASIQAVSPTFATLPNSRHYSPPMSSIPPIPKADYSPPTSRPKVTTRPIDDYVVRKEKTARKAIRTPSGHSFTASEYLKSYTPGQAALPEEGNI